MENYHIWSFQEENALIKPIYERVHRRKLGFFYYYTIKMYMTRIQSFLHNFPKIKGLYKHILYIDERNHLWKDYITATLKFLKVTLSIIIYVFIFIINHILRTVLKININLQTSYVHLFKKSFMWKEFIQVYTDI